MLTNSSMVSSMGSKGSYMVSSRFSKGSSKGSSKAAKLAKQLIDMEAAPEKQLTARVEAALAAEETGERVRTSIGDEEQLALADQADAE